MYFYRCCSRTSTRPSNVNIYLHGVIYFNGLFRSRKKWLIIAEVKKVFVWYLWVNKIEIPWMPGKKCAYLTCNVTTWMYKDLIKITIIIECNILLEKTYKKISIICDSHKFTRKSLISVQALLTRFRQKPEQKLEKQRYRPSHILPS